MSITLDALTLPSEMKWTDEFDWSAVEASNETTLSGKVIVTESLVFGQQGRLITLDGSMAWGDRSLMTALWDKYQQMGLEMTLKLHDGSLYNVRYRHWDYPALKATPINDTAYPDSTTIYNVIMKLVVI